jgi:hypothetical protein
MKPLRRIVKKNINAYSRGMDDRRKSIKELDERRRENLQFRSQTLKDLGKSLVERLDEAAFPGGEGGGYRRVKREIADSEASIQSIEAALTAIKELDEEIKVKKEEGADREDEAALLYARLGERVLNGSFPGSEDSPHRKQMEQILSRNSALEERLQDLDEKDGGIFSWFSKGIQSMIFNSSIKKNNKQLDRIYFHAGKQFARTAQKEPSAEDTAADDTAAEALLLRDTLAKQRELAELEDAVAELEQEKRKIQNSFGFREKPSSRIKVLEEQNRRRVDDLGGLYLRVGEDAAADKFSEHLSGEDKVKLEQARRYRERAEENGRDIEKLEAAISVDLEKEKIAKLERARSGQKERITEGEKNLAELGRRIEEANERIKETQKYIQELEQAGNTETETEGGT